MADRDPERQREAERKWYQENRQRVFDKKNRKKARLRQLIRILKERPCVDCGRRFPYYVMDFDHVEGEKLMMISKLANVGSMEGLLTEIAKCEAVCANCHRIRTWQRLEAAIEKLSQESQVDGPATTQLSLFPTQSWRPLNIGTARQLAPRGSGE